MNVSNIKRRKKEKVPLRETTFKLNASLWRMYLQRISKGFIRKKKHRNGKKRYEVKRLERVQIKSEPFCFYLA